MTKKFTVLSIEDNEADFTLLERSLNKIPDISLDIINISNGKDALNFLYKQGDFQYAPTPHIIILDINLPSINGKEILEAIKKDEKYKVIPVIIFSTSDYFTDIQEAYRLHANSYITKTFDVSELHKKIKFIGEYWLKNNELPDTNNLYFINREEEE